MVTRNNLHLLLNRKWVTVLMLLLLFLNGGGAQEMPLPVNLQYQLFVKILSFDKSLEKQTNDSLRLAVICQRVWRRSDQTARSFLAEAAADESPRIQNLPLSVRRHDLTTIAELRKFLVAGNIDVVYIGPLRAVAVSDITALTRELQVLSLSGVPEYQKHGVSVNLNIKGATPEILINQKRAKQEGADFSSRLLHLVTIINWE